MLNIVEDIEVLFSKSQNTKINNKIQKFVEEMQQRGQSVGYYRKHRNTSREKAVNDIFLGKKAEFFVAKCLEQYYEFPKGKPDLEIRKGKNKGWTHDLTYNKEEFPNIHVKSCSLKTYKYCNDYSWTFQYSDKSGFGKDDVFNNDDFSLIVLAYLDNPESSKGIIKAILSWKTAREYLKNPIKQSLIGMKLCLYYEDLYTDKKIIENVIYKT